MNFTPISARFTHDMYRRLCDLFPEQIFYWDKIPPFSRHPYAICFTGDTSSWIEANFKFKRKRGLDEEIAEEAFFSRGESGHIWYFPEGENEEEIRTKHPDWFYPVVTAEEFILRALSERIS